MLRIIFISFILFNLLHCKKESSNIVLKHEFQENETHYFEVVKLNYLDSNFRSLSNYTNTLLKISKSSINKDTSLYTFNYGKSYFKQNGKDIAFSDREKWIKTSYDKQKVIIHYSEQENSYQLKNYDNCKEFVNALYIKMLKAELDSLELKNISKIDDLISSLTDSEEKVLSIYFPEVELFLKNLNQSFNIDSSYNYKSFTHSPFSSNEISGNINISFEKKKDTIYILEMSSPDLHNLDKILDLEIDSIKGQFDINSEINSIPDPIYYDEIKSKYDIKNKVFLEINHIRSISLGEEQRFKHIQLKMVQ